MRSVIWRASFALALGLILPGSDLFADELPPHERAALSADAQEYAAGNNQFALDIYRQLAATNDGNQLVSPYSITMALGMTYAGARGQTAQQMADVLRFTLPEDRLHGAAGELMRDLDAERPGYQLNVANRLFAQEGFVLEPPFVQTTSEHYAAPVETLDFIRDTEDSRIHINDWVAAKTNDKIRDLLPQGAITEYTRLVLTNAIYFNGSWKYQFDEEATHEVPFFGSDGGPTTTAMMFQRQVFRYGAFDGYQMLEMPYAGDDLSMVVMLPDMPDGLAQFEQSLTAEKFNSSLATIYHQDVLTYLPKFKFEASFGLADTLQDMGMADAFSDQADLTGIADADLYISDVLHKAFIDVNEEGTEAAAATAVVVGTTCVCDPPEPPVFRADHPFMFALRDTHSGSLLFLGRVTAPGDSAITGATGSVVPEPASVLPLAAGMATWSLRRRRRRARRRCMANRHSCDRPGAPQCPRP